MRERTVSRGIIQCLESFLICQSMETGNYFLPGGELKQFESAMHALKREIQEECGLTLSNIKFLGLVENKYVSKNEAIFERNIIFYSKIRLDNLFITSKEPFISFSWFPKAEIKKIKLMPNSIAYLFNQSFPEEANYFTNF
jgi:8-oxo-dGTP pyrophosphatase MutT (NUDIX family)